MLNGVTHLILCPNETLSGAKRDRFVEMRKGAPEHTGAPLAYMRLAQPGEQVARIGAGWGRRARGQLEGLFAAPLVG